MKKCYSEEEWLHCNWRRVLGVRNNYTGPGFSGVSLTDMCWGRCYFINQGEQLIFGLPAATLLMSYCQQNQKNAVEDIPGADIEELGKHMTSLPYAKLMELGGFFLYARAGQGVCVPPMYMIGNVNAYHLAQPLSGEASEETFCDYMDARLWFVNAVASSHCRILNICWMDWCR